jgi:hypothetical protein
MYLKEPFLIPNFRKFTAEGFIYLQEADSKLLVFRALSIARNSKLLENNVS